MALPALPPSTASQVPKSVLRSRFLVTLPVLPETPALAEQVMIVTGANTGLGYEACLQLSRMGLARLIMGVRNLAKGLEAKEVILKATGRAPSSIDVWLVDMDDYSSVKAFAHEAATLPRLDGVLANAGIMTRKFRLSEGSESTMNVNVIGVFLLYALLLPAMERSERQTGYKPRFTIPNSALHHLAPLKDLHVEHKNLLERLNDPKQANMDGRYPLSKLIVLFIVRELASRTQSYIINTPSPGFCKSNLARENGSIGFKILESIVARTGEQGGRTLVHSLLAGEDTHGKYLSNCEIESPAPCVTGEWGQFVQQKLFGELVAKLDTIQAGLGQRLSA